MDGKLTERELSELKLWVELGRSRSVMAKVTPRILGILVSVYELSNTDLRLTEKMKGGHANANR